MKADYYWKKRGFPWEHDPGPGKGTSYANIFSKTPNYRGLSKEALGREKFRHHHGPMFYRGRLGKMQVKVLIIGQEGAQDESLSHRSFTGGTGARMQHFLNFLGIDYSYLFLNTFVYPIYGQYDNKIKWLAQNEDSPITKHRHKLFNHVIKKNKVDLIVAVGTAAKESVKTWVESTGGTCPNGTKDLSTSKGGFLKGTKTKVVGVMHPGGAGKGGSVAKIKATFVKVIKQAKKWHKADKKWLEVDPGSVRDFDKDYKYSSRPIPFYDFPYGENWRLGRGGTSSNRKDRQRSIQLFSKGGKYNNSGDYVKYSDWAYGTKEGYIEDSGEVPYEPPSKKYKDFDPGPPASLAKLMMGGNTGLEWPPVADLGVTSHESLGYGPIYRGKLSKPTILIVADQQSHDDLFSTRALTGESGQRLQAFLKAAGIIDDYVIIRVFPFDTLDLTQAKKNKIAKNPQVIKVYDAILSTLLAKKRTKVMLAMGTTAQTLLGKMNLNVYKAKVINMKSWKDSGSLADWKTALAKMKKIRFGKDIKNPSFKYEGEMLQVARHHLPFGTLKWKGTSGDRGRRGIGKSNVQSPNYYKLFMPDWAYKEKPRALTKKEKDAIADHP